MEITEAKTPAKKRLHPVLTAGIKIAVTSLCLWLVSRKIDWALTWQLLLGSTKWWLLAATMLFIISKVTASFRLNIYFRNIAVQLSQVTNLRLYWLGMFYNLFLPGGIGGDAYKVYLLHKKRGYPARLLSAAVLLDRISGVAGLGILIAVYYFLIYTGAAYSGWLLAAVLPGLALYYVFVRLLFPSFISSCWSTLVLGVAVQFFQVLCVYCIMASVGIHLMQSQVVLLFLLSSVVAILPFTIGGLGAREVVFLWGSQQFGLDVHQSIYISILFYLITLVVSLVGVRWVYSDPLQQSK